MERLEDAGFLSGEAYTPREKSETQEHRSPTLQSTEKQELGAGRDISGAPWFEEMIEGSELGRIKKRRGGGRTSDGKTIVEYEITEFESNGGDSVVSGRG